MYIGAPGKYVEYCDVHISPWIVNFCWKVSCWLSIAPVWIWLWTIEMCLHSDPKQILIFSLNLLSLCLCFAAWQAHWCTEPCRVISFVFNIVFVTVCAASCYTEATMLFSRQSTLDDLDGPDTVPKTSERARPRLRKMQSMDMSSSSADSGSIVSRCLTHACFVHSFTHTIILNAVYINLSLQICGVQSGLHG